MSTIQNGPSEEIVEFHTGKLLIATPELMDSNFFRSVSLLFHHDRTGAGGVILNRPSNVTFADVWDDIAVGSKFADHPIHAGGPVEGPLMGLHSNNLGNVERQILPGIWLSVTKDLLGELITEHTESIKIFSGYAGWGPGQLEREIQAGGWLTLDCQADDIFETPEEIWRSACSQVGNQIMFAGKRDDSVSKIDPLAN